MTPTLSRLGSLLVLLVASGLPCAHADIYTWTDAAGQVNVSNLTPPPDAHVTHVFHASPEDAAREQAAREAAQQNQLAALTAQVQQLQDEVAAQRESASTPGPTYWVPASALDYQSVADTPAPQVYYDDNLAQQAASGCDVAWNCGVWTLPFFYPASIVVVGAPGYRRLPPHRNPGYPPGKPPRGPAWPQTGRPTSTQPAMHAVAQMQPRVFVPQARSVTLPQPQMGAPQPQMASSQPTRVTAGAARR